MKCSVNQPVTPTFDLVFVFSKINQNGQVVIILFSLRSQNIILYPFKLTKKDKKINDGMKRGQRPNSSEQTYTTARVVG